MKQTCYVCNHVIDGTPVYIGQDKYRHMRCEAGGKRWMRVQEAKPKRQRSALFEVFKDALKN